MRSISVPESSTKSWAPGWYMMALLMYSKERFSFTKRSPFSFTRRKASMAPFARLPVLAPAGSFMRIWGQSSSAAPAASPMRMPSPVLVIVGLIQAYTARSRGRMRWVSISQLNS